MYTVNFRLTFTDVEQKMIEAQFGADARPKWAQDHIIIGFTG